MLPGSSCGGNGDLARARCGGMDEGDTHELSVDPGDCGLLCGLGSSTGAGPGEPSPFSEVAVPAASAAAAFRTFLLWMMKAPRAAATANTAKTPPTAIPAFAPPLKPVFLGPSSYLRLNRRLLITTVPEPVGVAAGIKGVGGLVTQGVWPPRFVE